VHWQMLSGDEVVKYPHGLSATRDLERWSNTTRDLDPFIIIRERDLDRDRDRECERKREGYG